MNGSPGAARALARHADEETRYQAVGALDPADGADRAVLLEALGDASWRVRSAAAERVAASPDPVAACRALVEILCAGSSVGAREAAAGALARLGRAVVPPLVERLGADDPEERQAIAAVLGAIADRRTVAALTARLADRDPNVRAAAAEALGKIGGPEAAEALRAAVESDDATLRLAALDALVRGRASVPVAQLERLLADRALRRPAYRLLGACEDPGALPLVLRGLCEPARSVREAALGALGDQRARRAGDELAPLLAGARAAAARDPGLADAWAGSLAAEEPAERIGALTVLGVAGAARHVAAMLRLAEDERTRALAEDAVEALPASAEVRGALAEALPGLGQLSRIAALTALARLGSPAALESLVRDASDPEAYLQGEAVAALGRIGDARAVEPLCGLLADDAPAVAGAASTALLRIAGAGAAARAAVVRTLRARAGASPSAALLRALGAVGDPGDLALLLGGLRADGATARRVAAAAAVASLARRDLVPPGPLPALVAALADPAWPVRAAAARAFVELARARGAREPACAGATEALAAALRDPEAAVVAAAAEALGACGLREHAADLAALVAAPAPAPVVVAALHALVALRAATAELVVRAAAHEDPEVVKEAVHAAARLPEGERVLREAAASPRWDVRQAAARALAARGDRALAAEAERLAAADPDPLVARAFAEAARVLGAR